MRIKAVLAVGCVFAGLLGCNLDAGERDRDDKVGTAEGAVAKGITSIGEKASTPAGLVSASQCWDLSQGPKNNDLGDVCVSNDESTLYVAYTTDGGCLLTEVHVCVATSDFPWTPPGQCPYKAEFHDNPTTSYTVSVPLSDFPGAACGETVFTIQAHAALDCSPSGGGGESAYAGTFKGNVEYTLQCTGDGGCTLTQGYWKNHPEDWSFTTVTLGGVTYNQTTAIGVLNTPVGGDASLILAHQLIAAKLNIALGGADGSALGTTIADADAWLAANADADGWLPFGVSAASAAGAQAVALAAVLDDFNNGLIGPGHCED